MQVCARNNLKGLSPRAGMVVVAFAAVLPADGDIHFDCLFATGGRLRLIRYRMVMQNRRTLRMGLLRKTVRQRST
jgi:hypothetical protein